MPHHRVPPLAFEPHEQLGEFSQLAIELALRMVVHGQDEGPEPASQVADEPLLDYLLARLQRSDLVLVEGFKNGNFPKLEVWRAALARPLLWPAWPGIVAIARDAPLPAPGVTRLDLADTAAIADFVLSGAAAS